MPDQPRLVKASDATPVSTALYIPTTTSCSANTLPSFAKDEVTTLTLPAPGA